jgi:hypothetical protein
MQRDYRFSSYPENKYIMSNHRIKRKIVALKGPMFTKLNLILYSSILSKKLFIVVYVIAIVSDGVSLLAF